MPKKKSLIILFFESNLWSLTSNFHAWYSLTKRYHSMSKSQAKPWKLAQVKHLPLGKWCWMLWKRKHFLLVSYTCYAVPSVTWWKSREYELNYRHQEKTWIMWRKWLCMDQYVRIIKVYSNIYNVKMV